MIEFLESNAYFAQNLAEQRFGQLAACVEMHSGRAAIGMALDDMTPLLPDTLKTQPEQPPFHLLGGYR